MRSFQVEMSSRSFLIWSDLIIIFDKLKEKDVGVVPRAEWPYDELTSQDSPV